MSSLSARIERLRWENIPMAFTTWLYPPYGHVLSTTEQTYRYNIEDSDVNLPMLRYDPVLGAIIRAIREVAEIDMCVAASRIRVYSVINCPPIWPFHPGNRDVVVKFYAFELRNNEVEFPLTVPITVSNRGNSSPLTADRIFVRTERKWMPLKDWLVKLPRRDVLLRDRNRAFQTQQIWWDHNGKHFRFMELPDELQLCVLKQVMGGVIYPSVHFTFATVQGIWQPLPGAARVVMGDRTLPVPNYNILRVSKDIKEKALQAGWEGTVKRFKTCLIFRSVLITPNLPTGYNWLTKVELKFNLVEYFLFFWS
jgi:hypothetical protein